MPYKDKNKQLEYNRLWMAKRRRDYFIGKCCVQCGVTENLHLDHKDPKTKVSHRIWSWTKAKRDVELAKCQVLCVKHHKEKTKKERSITEHGSRSATMYTNGCRCDLCREAQRVRIAEQRRRKKNALVAQR